MDKINFLDSEEITQAALDLFDAVHNTETEREKATEYSVEDVFHGETPTFIIEARGLTAGDSFVYDFKTMFTQKEIDIYHLLAFFRSVAESCAKLYSLNADQLVDAYLAYPGNSAISRDAARADIDKYISALCTAAQTSEEGE